MNGGYNITSFKGYHGMCPKCEGIFGEPCPECCPDYYAEKADDEKLKKECGQVVCACGGNPECNRMKKLKQLIRERQDEAYKEGVKHGETTRYGIRRFYMGCDSKKKEIIDMIETKLRNDPDNPVLKLGLEYVLVAIKKNK